MQLIYPRLALELLLPVRSEVLVWPLLVVSPSSPRQELRVTQGLNNFPVLAENRQ